MDSTNKTQGFIYFIETVDGSFIKIGFSTNVHQRLAALGTIRPGDFELRLLGCIAGTLDTEATLHTLFHEERDKGEWFHASDKLKHFISALPMVDKATLKRYRVERDLPEDALTCLRCSHSWMRRTMNRPKQCPKCTSPYWDIAAGELPRGLAAMDSAQRRKISRAGVRKRRQNKKQKTS